MARIWRTRVEWRERDGLSCRYGRCRTEGDRRTVAERRAGKRSQACTIES